MLSGRRDLAITETTFLDTEDWDFAGEDTQYLLHSIHPYPARFIPQIPRRAIERWSRAGDTVLDPFCGGGTTNLEAALCGRDSVGIDNNGVALLLTEAKTAEYDEHSFREVERLIHQVQSRFAKWPLFESDLFRRSKILQYPNVENWFDPHALAELSWLKSEISLLTKVSKTLLLAVLSSIVVQVSRQDSDTRYATVNRRYNPGTAVTTWLRKAISALSAARETMQIRPPTQHKIVAADSRNLESIRDESIDLIVTSPPYLNAYDYHKYHRHRLHWIDANIAFARDLEIGKHDTYTRPGAKPDSYFDDLQLCMREWARVLRRGSTALVVVGDAIVSGEFIAVADELVNRGEAVGLGLQKRWIRRIDGGRKSFNAASRIKREHILLFTRG